MTEITAPADNNSANTLGGNDNTPTTNGKPTKQRNRVKNNKKKSKDKGNGKLTGPPFKGLSKEEFFKGVVIEDSKLAIQARNLRDALWTHSNNKNQPRVADSIKYKKPLKKKQFVTAKLDSTNWMVPKEDGSSQEEAPGLKRTKKLSMDHPIKH